MSDELRIGDGVVRILRDDITRVDADAIVNAANEFLAHGGGVAGAIVRAGGSSIQRESDALAPVPTGEAVITSGGRLRARHVIHAVGPRGGMPDADRLLESAVLASLRVAEEHGIKSVAFPAISTGIFGYPLHKCAAIMTRVAAEWLGDSAHGVRTILLVLYDDRALREFRTALERVAGGSG